jgi:hypothetical protein
MVPLVNILIFFGRGADDAFSASQLLKKKSRNQKFFSLSLFTLSPTMCLDLGTVGFGVTFNTNKFLSHNIPPK